MTIIPSSSPHNVSLSYDDIAAVIEQSYDGMLVIDGNADVVLVNDAYFRITGIPKKDIVGQNFRKFMQNSPYKKAACIAALENKKSITQTHNNLMPGKIVMVTSTPIFDAKGHVRFVVSNGRDMSEMVVLREQLEKAQKIEEQYYQSLEGQTVGPIAVDSKMKEFYISVLKVSSVDITVLITGESGVGKDVVARYIHNNSPRKEAPFVAVNCGAIPENLLESEFFGYVAGAFTGACKTGKKGLFETADGGTLFLDELGDLPFSLQVKLLRALDTNEITRVGSSCPIPVNIRLLAATNQDLEQMVQEQKFREDLYYRLNVINLHIPPLRERPDDIRPLCMYFLHGCNKRYGQNKRINLEVLKSLESHSWPGNIRQLKHTIERMLVLSNGEYLELSSLPRDICLTEELINNSESIIVNRFIPIPQAIEDVEKQLLCYAMKHHGSSRQIAKVTGIDQTTVLRKIKKYGLQKPR